MDEIRNREKEMDNDPCGLYPIRNDPNPTNPCAHGTTWYGHEAHINRLLQKMDQLQDDFKDCKNRNFKLPKGVPCVTNDPIVFKATPPTWGGGNYWSLPNPTFPSRGYFPALPPWEVAY